MCSIFFNSTCSMGYDPPVDCAIFFGIQATGRSVCTKKKKKNIYSMIH